MREIDDMRRRIEELEQEIRALHNKIDEELRARAGKPAVKLYREEA